MCRELQVTTWAHPHLPPLLSPMSPHSPECEGSRAPQAPCCSDGSVVGDSVHVRLLSGIMCAGNGSVLCGLPASASLRKYSISRSSEVSQHMTTRDHW